VENGKIFVVVKNCQRRPKVKIFSTFVFLFGILWFVMEPVCWNLHRWWPLNDRLNKMLCYTRQRKNPDVIRIHCFLYREVLPSKIIGEDLKQVLDVAVNMVNFIKQRHLKSHMFAKLCENMQKDHVTLLQDTEVRWLSRGKVLTRVFSCERNYCISSKIIIIKPVFLTFLKIQNGY
jgi:hypothetical protein